MPYYTVILRSGARFVVQADSLSQASSGRWIFTDARPAVRHLDERDVVAILEGTPAKAEETT